MKDTHSSGPASAVPASSDDLSRQADTTAAKPNSADGRLLGRLPQRWRTALRGLLSIAVVAAILWGARSQVDFGQVATVIGDMSWLEILTLVIAAAWNILTYLFVMLAAMPGLTYRQAFLVGQSSTAIAATLPAGAALGIGVTYAMYASYGHSGPKIGLAAVVSGLWNNFVKLAMPIVAFALLVMSGGASADLQTAAIVGVVVLLAVIGLFGALLADDHFALLLGRGAGRAVNPLRRLVRKPPVSAWGEAAVRFRNETIGLLRHRWLTLTAATVVSHVSLFIVLLLALRHVGVSAGDVSWQEALAAFAVMRLLTAVPITPGGLGIVELGLSAALIVAGGARAPVVAAVLIFRFLTLVVQVPIGAVCYLLWTRRHRGQLRFGADREVHPAQPGVPQR